MNIDSIKTDMKDIHQRLVNKIFIEKCLEEFVDLTYQYDIDIKLLKNDRDKKERQVNVCVYIFMFLPFCPYMHLYPCFSREQCCMDTKTNFFLNKNKYTQ